MKYKINIEYLSAIYVGSINESLCAFLGEHFIFTQFGLSGLCVLETLYADDDVC